MQFSDLQLEDFGTHIMMSGAIYSNGSEEFLIYFPNEEVQPNFSEVKPTIEEWEALIKQTDDVLVNFTNPDLSKVLVKKSQRNLDQTIVWKVYQRDNYTCRYCGRTGIPLTVDHIDLWEDGGITTELNLNTCCKQCNRNRGNMKYQDWLNSDSYKKASVGIAQAVKDANAAQVALLPELEKRRCTKQRAKR